MKKRTAGARPPSASREADLVPLSCPDCFGVLRFGREGHRGHLLYTAESLINAKERQLEEVLWSAGLLLKQMAYAYEDLLAEMPESSASDRRRIRRRITEVRAQSLAIRGIIEASHAPE